MSSNLSPEELEVAYASFLNALSQQFERPGDLIDALRETMSQISGTPKQAINRQKLTDNYRGWAGSKKKIPTDAVARARGKRASRSSNPRIRNPWCPLSA
jgi:hypothetical protein